MVEVYVVDTFFATEVVFDSDTVGKRFGETLSTLSLLFSGKDEGCNLGHSPKSFDKVYNSLLLDNITRSSFTLRSVFFLILRCYRQEFYEFIMYMI